MTIITKENALAEIEKHVKVTYLNVRSGIYHKQVKLITDKISFELKEQKECGVLKFESYVNKSDLLKAYEHIPYREKKIEDALNEMFPVFDFVFRKMNKNCCAYFTFLGQHYYKTHDFIEKFLLYIGFKVIAEYPNYQHGPNYYQRMYLLNTDDWGENSFKK